MDAENRKYWHNYAHLNGFSVSAGNTVGRGQLVGQVGCTGQNCTGPHLHFHMTLDVNKDDVNQIPVDLSPLRGFRPNLNYPTSGICGQIEPRSSNPLIIDPITFTARWQPRDNHYWFFYTSDDLANQYTGEAFMSGVPDTDAGWDPLDTSQSPQVDYNNMYVDNSGTYYLWVCGFGGNFDNDSVHLGYNGSAPVSSQNMSGWNAASWQWWSVKMDLTRPYVQATGGADRMVNVWMREDGLRIDRILMTQDVNYNPSGNIRCGGY